MASKCVCQLIGYLELVSVYPGAVISYKNVPDKNTRSPPGPWTAHGCSPSCRRMEAMFRALWRHQGVSAELGDQGTPFKELCVGIVDACMLSPMVGP